jgi:toxin ParE1/3/4
MIATEVVVLPLAEQDMREAIVWYRQQGGRDLALKWTDAVEVALGHIGKHPAAGSPRYAAVLQIGGLRFWPIRKFPYLAFYLEHDSRVDVLRILHAERDIPTWMQTSKIQQASR